MPTGQSLWALADSRSTLLLTPSPEPQRRGQSWLQAEPGTRITVHVGAPEAGPQLLSVSHARQQRRQQRRTPGLAGMWLRQSSLSC